MNFIYWEIRVNVLVHLNINIEIFGLNKFCDRLYFTILRRLSMNHSYF